MLPRTGVVFGGLGVTEFLMPKELNIAAAFSGMEPSSLLSCGLEAFPPGP